MSFTTDLYRAYQRYSNSENAIAMKAYMRDKFEFFGIKATQRREILKEISKSHIDQLRYETRELARELYSSDKREMHMCAMEIVAKYLKKKYLPEDLDFIEFLISTNSWWDTVDFIAKNILGQYLIQYPEMIPVMLKKFTASDDMWLNRSTIIYQLGYKSNTNESILFKQCETFSHSTEFFIQKAIGWSLREYGKTNPQSVINFVNSISLKPLSRREAIRNIK